MAIKFLFFPFTHMSESHLNTVLTFFPSIQYLPMARNFDHRPDLQKLFKQGKITPFFSSSDQVAAVKQSLDQYLAWARIHKGNEVNLKSLLKNTPYFTNDSDVTAIKSQIKGGGNLSAENASDTVLPAESNLHKDFLFLKMAHLHDEQNEGIDLALKELDTSHDALMSTLRGPDLSSEQGQALTSGGSSDAGTLMTGRRIHAWARCMAATGGLNQEGGTPLFITTSEAVFDYLESNCKDLVNALDIDPIKVHENGCENKNEWHRYFCGDLMRAIMGQGVRESNLPKADDNCSLWGKIKLGLFSGNDINHLFNLPDKQIYVCLIKLK